MIDWLNSYAMPQIKAFFNIINFLCKFKTYQKIAV